MYENEMPRPATLRAGIISLLRLLDRVSRLMQDFDQEDLSGTLRSRLRNEREVSWQ
jgi:hypothetical protein